MFVSMVRNDDSEISFRRSAGVRNAILLIFGALDVWSYIYFANQIKQIPIGDYEKQYAYCVPILMVVILNVLGLKFSGPSDLVLDIDRQLYTYTTGYPWLPKVATGSFGDFYGLCVRPIKNRNKKIVYYQVELDWNAPDLPSLVLCKTNSATEAHAQQNMYAHRLVSIPVAKD